MSWLKDMFGVEQPIIAMLHLAPLPGDPLFKNGTKLIDIIHQARKDLHALQNGGVDGILISNEFSFPYQREMSFVTPASMARIIGELKSDINVPFGVDCISDALATIELAAAVECDFIRGTFSGVYSGDGGLYNNDISMLLRRKHDLGIDHIKMLYFLNPESDVDLSFRPIKEIAKSIIFKCKPDCLCVSANAAGANVNVDILEEVKTVAGSVPVFCNTGLKLETVEQKLSACDGGCVGTTFKVDGKLENSVDLQRVKAFMEHVNSIRK